MTNPNDCAFPADYRTQSDGGLTKREYFAAMAMQGIITSPQTAATWEKIVEVSIKVADLLIEELNKPKDNGTIKR